MYDNSGELRQIPSVSLEETPMDLARRIDNAIADKIARPIFFRVSKDENGEIQIKQIQFLGTEELAAITTLEPRTIRDWAVNKDCPLRFYRVPGSSKLLVDMEEAVTAIKSGALDNHTSRS